MLILLVKFKGKGNVKKTYQLLIALQYACLIKRRDFLVKKENKEKTAIQTREMFEAVFDILAVCNKYYLLGPIQ